MNPSLIVIFKWIKHSKLSCHKLNGAVESRVEKIAKEEKQSWGFQDHPSCIDQAQ